MKKRKKIVLIVITIVLLNIIAIILAFKITSSKKGIHSILGFTYIDISQECYISEDYTTDEDVINSIKPK